MGRGLSGIYPYDICVLVMEISGENRQELKSGCLRRGDK